MVQFVIPAEAGIRGIEALLDLGYTIIHSDKESQLDKHAIDERWVYIQRQVMMEEPSQTQKQKKESS